MSYIITQRRSELNVKQDDLLASKRYIIERKPEPVFFYELEAAVVLDVILDDAHPAFTGKNLDAEDWPVDANGEPAKEGQPNYGWIGMIKFRFLNSQQNTVKEILSWAVPMENTGITEYPLMNEVVVVGKYLGNYYYGKKVNLKKQINTNANFQIERVAGHVSQNTDEYSKEPYTGPVSVLNGGSKDQKTNPNHVGNLGSYFKFNPAIRAIQRYEGDSIIESRFGSSIRFGAYDGNRKNDVGLGEYSDNGGNPMILIRNRQEPVKGKSELPKLINKGYTLENVNEDGTSIHITSGKTISLFKPTTKKIMFSKTIKEEQSMFSPDGSTEFDYPEQSGDQVVINSDRLIFSSKAAETFHFSKKRYSIVTDDEFTVDAHKQVVVTTNKSTTINSPFIYLGEHGATDEPVLLGRTSVFWLHTLCEWLLNQTDWLITNAEWELAHVHDDDSGKDVQKAPKSEWVNKMKTYISNMKDMQTQLKALRDQLPSLMSQRVFTVGGGGEPGQDGGTLS